MLVHDVGQPVQAQCPLSRGKAAPISLESGFCVLDRAVDILRPTDRDIAGNNLVILGVVYREDLCGTRLHVLAIDPEPRQVRRRRGLKRRHIVL